MHSDEQVILAGEEVIERPNRHLGAVDDVLHREVDASALGHQLHGGADETIGALLSPGARALKRALDAQALPFGHGVVVIDLLDRLGHLDSCHLTYTFRMRRRRISDNRGFCAADISFPILLWVLQGSGHPSCAQLRGVPSRLFEERGHDGDDFCGVVLVHRVAATLDDDHLGLLVAIAHDLGLPQATWVVLAPKYKEDRASDPCDCVQVRLRSSSCPIAELEHDVEPVILAMSLCVEATQRGRPTRLQLRSGWDAGLWVAKSWAHQDQAGSRSRINQLKVKRGLGTERERQYVWGIEVFMVNQRTQVCVDGFDAHVPGLVVRLSVSAQVGDDEPVTVIERANHFRPLVGTSSSRAVHTQHRGTGPANLVMKIEAIPLIGRHRQPSDP